MFLEQTIFYHIERTIKRYRQFAQARLNEAGFDITVDQWLVLNTILKHQELSQADIAQRVFKDQASVARITDLLVKKGYLSRATSANDRRRNEVAVTPEGLALMEAVMPTVKLYRNDALNDISPEDIKHMQTTLDAIFDNCNSPT
ncbi:MAG: MarR family transcriptional regulator [Saprospiraceae bacterium]|jgi:DNA-binding MarR family transcriptional regulator|nr:MarR family transcriptional regulator [Saprospiraceae bacterium]